MKFFLLFFLIFLLRNNGHAQEIMITESPRSKLTIHKTDHKFQLINDQGDSIISGLDSAYYNKDFDLFLIQKKGLWGMISIYGKVLLPAAYNKLEQSYNWFWVVTKNKKKGIFDTYKGEILPAEFDDIQFSGKLGKEFIVKKDGKTGVFNDKGDKIIQVAYDAIENKAGALVLKEKNKTSYFIGDKIISDTIVLDKTFEVYGNYISDNKTYFVFCKNGRYGLIDHKCNVVMEPKYQDILYRYAVDNHKAESFLLVKQDNLWGMIDLTEKQIISFQYQNIELINLDFAIIKINAYKYFYNFRTKKLMEDYNFESFYMFSEAYSRVNKDGKESLVDNKHGFKLLLPFIYEDVLMYDQYIVVKQNSRYGVVDTANHILIPIQYKSVSISCNKVIAEKDGKYGILSIDNKVLLPFEYSYIIGYSEKIETKQINSPKIKTYNCNLKCIENCD